MRFQSRGRAVETLERYIKQFEVLELGTVMVEHNDRGNELIILLTPDKPPAFYEKVGLALKKWRNESPKEIQGLFESRDGVSLLLEWASQDYDISQLELTK